MLPDGQFASSASMSQLLSAICLRANFCGLLAFQHATPDIRHKILTAIPTVPDTTDRKPELGVEGGVGVNDLKDFGIKNAEEGAVDAEQTILNSKAPSLQRAAAA
ncbi:hypothetical protein CDAR_286881 [Caerostris darwini]|uniref:Uncharacterized protein n=1 Tax=Caerostris darwini TaxID=1538125 RepID=A0AAV4RAM2_9ARAC|nr:hypothetical protein CDAR_286881 [Caerostris darwini]